MRNRTETLRYKLIRRVITYITSERSVTLRDCLIVYLHYVYGMSIKSLASVRHQDTDVRRASLFDAEKKVNMLLPRPWSVRFRAYVRMTDKGAPTLFYARTKSAVFALSPQAITNVIRKATRAALNIKEREDATKLLARNMVAGSSSMLAGLRKIYEKNHPRAH